MGIRHPRNGRWDRRGSVAILVALSLPVLLVVLGFGVDASDWAWEQARLQRTLDLASVAGAARLAAGAATSDILNTAATVAELNGQPVGTRTLANSTLTDNAGSGAMTITATTSSVTVTATRQIPRFFSSLFMPSSTQPVSSRAVAALTSSGNAGVACLLSLSASQTAYLNGGVSINMPGCDYRSNGSIVVNGQQSVVASSMVAGGTITQNGNAICSQLVCVTSAPQEPDPYASLYQGAMAVPSQSVQVPQNNTTLSPPPSGESYYWSLNGGNYTMEPGVYYVNGDFNVNGNVSLTGDGVTIIPSGNVNIDGSSTVTLTAPASGATAGLLFGSLSSGFNLNGGSNIHLTGEIYAPNASLYVDGGNAATGNCLYIVAATITFNGGGQFTDTNCQAAGMVAVHDSSSLVALVQ